MGKKTTGAYNRVGYILRAVKRLEICLVRFVKYYFIKSPTSLQVAVLNVCSSYGILMNIPVKRMDLLEASERTMVQLYLYIEVTHIRKNR